jgi:succinate dehydrogenase / fumarate reductase membrane anchor subunit
MALSKTEFRTPLARVSGLGSAKDGTNHWWQQRFTAVALVPLVLIFWIIALKLVGSSHAVAAAVLKKPMTAGIATLLIIIGLWHLKLGAQVIVEDYVHHDGLKFALIIAIAFACALIGLASLFAIAKLAFGV